jgi:hypothetical protein
MKELEKTYNDQLYNSQTQLQFTATPSACPPANALKLKHQTPMPRSWQVGQFMPTVPAITSILPSAIMLF